MIKSAASFCLENGGVRAKQWKEFSTIYLFAVTADLEEVFVIAELPTTHEAMQFLGQPMRLVSNALAVSQGQIGRKEVPGWQRSHAILSVVMVERR